MAEVRVAPASRADVQKGLLGYVSCTLDGRYRIDGLALRRTAQGRHTISFPENRRGFLVLRPRSAALWRDLETQILHELGLDQEAAS